MYVKPIYCLDPEFRYKLGHFTGFFVWFIARLRTCSPFYDPFHQQIEETSIEVTNRRSKVPFSPKDVDEVVSGRKRETQLRFPANLSSSQRFAKIKKNSDCWPLRKQHLLYLHPPKNPIIISPEPSGFPFSSCFMFQVAFILKWKQFTIA